MKQCHGNITKRNVSISILMIETLTHCISFDKGWWIFFLPPPHNGKQWISKGCRSLTLSILYHRLATWAPPFSTYMVHGTSLWHDAITLQRAVATSHNSRWHWTLKPDIWRVTDQKNQRLLFPSHLLRKAPVTFFNVLSWKSVPSAPQSRLKEADFQCFHIQICSSKHPWKKGELVLPHFQNLRKII